MGSPSRHLPALLLAAFVASAFLAPSAAAEQDSVGWSSVPSASAALRPAKLPRSRTAPARLSIRFKGARDEAGKAMDLDSIRFGLAPSVAFRTAGLPSCRARALFSYEAASVCAGSKVGSGEVDSEITPPGGEAVHEAGEAEAYYSLAGGEPRVLLEVTTPEPLPLVYVIPFELLPRHGNSGPALLATRMRSAVLGKCAAEHPGCFGHPYSFQGIYGHILSLDLQLRRNFAWRGGRRSFVNASCPAPVGTSQAIFPLAKIQLGYEEGDFRLAVAAYCKVAS